MSLGIGTSGTAKALSLAERAGVLRAREARAKGIPGMVLSRLVEEGKLRRIGRGLYEPAEPTKLTENHGLAEVAKRAPDAVVCLLSALRFHQLTNEEPWEVWLAIGDKAWKPRPGTTPVRYVRARKDLLRKGVETHRIDGVLVHITTPERTVADAFKYRGKVGTSVALEALRDYLRRPNRDLVALREQARAVRSERVMAPYIEALV
jgi:predicted transcriptional regulator of viral defense system